MTNILSRLVTLDLTQLSWFPNLPVNDDFHISFNTSVIKPKDIKDILWKKKATSAPGDDGLMYGLLKHLPLTHHLMATIFTKLLLVDPLPPESWSQSKAVLIHKAGETEKPENFRMISLTSSIAKIFHQIIAERLGSYLTTNMYIDPTVQKAFLKGVNGCIKHNQVLQETIAHAKDRKKQCTSRSLIGLMPSGVSAIVSSTIPWNVVRSPRMSSYMSPIYILISMVMSKALIGPPSHLHLEGGPFKAIHCPLLFFLCTSTHCLNILKPFVRKVASV